MEVGYTRWAAAKDYICIPLNFAETFLINAYQEIFTFCRFLYHYLPACPGTGEIFYHCRRKRVQQRHREKKRTAAERDESTEVM